MPSSTNAANSYYVYDQESQLNSFEQPQDGNEVDNGQGSTWNDRAEVCGQMEGDANEEMKDFAIWLDYFYQDSTSNS